MSKSGSRKILLIVLVLAIIVVGIAAIVMTFYSSNFSMKLKGDEEMTVGLNAVYEDQGVKAVIDGRDVSDKVKVTGEVDTSKPGTYELKYSVEDLKAVRKVTVLDKMNPEIILEGSEKVDGLKLGDKFDEPGYKATDENGKDITDKVKVEGSDIRKAGTNTVSYTVSDNNGNTTRVTREVEVAANTDYGAPGLPICMYHYVYDENDPPDDLNQRFGNYISMQDLEEELNWLNEEGYYYPTWKEVRDYVDGKLLLPDKSIVLCFDDGAVSFLENGIPVLEKCKTPATCFMITSYNGEEKIAQYQSDYVVYESHSDNMHRGGGNIGHGGIFTAVSEEDGLADLKRSIEVCGSGDAFAYPFGDYNERSRSMVEKAGFLCAVTTEYGKAEPGDDPLLLPRVRMSMGQSLAGFQDRVSP